LVVLKWAVMPFQMKWSELLPGHIGVWLMHWIALQRVMVKYFALVKVILNSALEPAIYIYIYSRNQKEVFVVHRTQVAQTKVRPMMSK
jgi:hypothetical protein